MQIIHSHASKTVGNYGYSNCCCGLKVCGIRVLLTGKALLLIHFSPSLSLDSELWRPWLEGGYGGGGGGGVGVDGCWEGCRLGFNPVNLLFHLSEQ